MEENIKVCPVKIIEEEIDSYFVAYSGGLDSSVLLLEVQEALKKSKFN